MSLEMAELRNIEPYPNHLSMGGVIFEVVTKVKEDDEIENLIDDFEKLIEEKVETYSSNSEVYYDLCHTIGGPDDEDNLMIVQGYHVEIVTDESDKTKYLRAVRRVSTPRDLRFPVRVESYRYVS